MGADEVLVELLIRFEDAAAAGTPVTPEELCRERPQLLPELRELLRKVGAVNAALEGAATDSVDADYSIGAVVDDRYRPLGFHAAGGMGVVFTAEDGEVGRTVALKRMQGWAAADETACERFLAEAEVTGRLEHPGVVPVYGLGRDAAGQPYYAMRFIGGSTLREEIHGYHAVPGPDRPIEFARLLRAFAAVCETVAYAHARGVVHRDIKPGNVMLGPYGETLLVDWGLAKRVGVPDPEATTDPGAEPLSASAVGAPTVPGVVKGTPAYMSPEQARGETNRIGPASDVFGLGATLYALLTGRPPYEGPSAIGQAREGRFAAPRQSRRDVPRPLEAICLKAMAVRPEDRYTGAKELARDIERWLADEPVSAWREPRTVRARRWAKRHRTLLAAAIATLVVAAAGLGALAALEARNNRKLRDANDDLVESNARVNRNYDRARQATRALAEYTLSAPGLRQARFVSIPENVLQSEQTEKGLQEVRRALQILSEDRPDDLENRADLAGACQLLGLVYEARGRRADALASLAEARELRGIIHRTEPGNPGAILSLVAVDTAEGRLHLKAGDGKSAERYFEKGLAALEPFTRDNDAGDDLQFARAHIEQSLATVRALNKNWLAAIELSEKARSRLTRLATRHPKNSLYREELARCDFLMGSAYSELGFEAFQKANLPAAIGNFERADVLLRPLVRQQARLEGFRERYEIHLKRWGAAVLQRSIALSQTKTTPELLALFEKFVPVWEELAREEQDLREVQVMLTRLRVGLADTCLAQSKRLDPSKPDQLRECHRLVSAGLEALSKLPPEPSKEPAVAQLRQELRRHYYSLPVLKE